MTAKDEEELLTAVELDAEAEQAAAADAAELGPGQRPHAWSGSPGVQRRQAVLGGGRAGGRARGRPVAVTAWLYVDGTDRDNRLTDAAAAEAAIRAATGRHRRVAVFTPRSPSTRTSNASALLTEISSNYYNQFTEQIVTPAATGRTRSRRHGHRRSPGGRRECIWTRRSCWCSSTRRPPAPSNPGRFVLHCAASRSVCPRSANTGGITAFADLYNAGVRAADLVLSGGGVKGVELIGIVVALMDAGFTGATYPARRRAPSARRLRLPREGGSPVWNSKSCAGPTKPRSSGIRPPSADYR